LSIWLSQVKNGTTEWMFAKDALFSRHPEMPFWPIGMQGCFAYYVMAQYQLWSVWQWIISICCPRIILEGLRV